MPIPISQGSGQSSIASEKAGNNDYQQVEIYGAGGASVLGISPDGSIKVSVLSGANFVVAGGSVAAIQSGTRTTSIVGTVITNYAPTASFVSGVTSVISSTSQTSVLATAPGAQRNYVTNILVTNGAAVGTFVDIMDGPNIIYSGYAAASGGGFSATLPTPLRQSNTVQSLDMKARTQASIITAMSGYTAA